MKVAFISLGCAKNLVNTEQMMALCRDAGHTLLEAPAGADAVVINTCGFIDSAKEEAIDTILSVAALKAEGQVGKILVTGCLTQRYQQEILDELPEVDGILGINYLGFSPFLLSVRNASLQFLERSRFPVQYMKPLDVERDPSGIFYILCSRGGNTFPLALDSGSSLSMAPVEQWPADPNGNQLTTKATDINGHNGDCTVMKLGIPSTLRMGPDFQMDGLSFAVTGTGGRYQIGVDTFQHFDIIIDAPQGEVFALPPHSKPEPKGQKTPDVKQES